MKISLLFSSKDKQKQNINAKIDYTIETIISINLKKFNLKKGEKKKERC